MFWKKKEITIAERNYGFNEKLFKVLNASFYYERFINEFIIFLNVWVRAWSCKMRKTGNKTTTAAVGNSKVHNLNTRRPPLVSPQGWQLHSYRLYNNNNNKTLLSLEQKIKSVSTTKAVVRKTQLQRSDSAVSISVKRTVKIHLPVWLFSRFICVAKWQNHFLLYFVHILMQAYVITYCFLFRPFSFHYFTYHMATRSSIFSLSFPCFSVISRFC